MSTTDTVPDNIGTPRQGELDPATAKALEAAISAPCDIRLRQDGKRFTLYLPDLGLTVRGENLAALQAELMTQRVHRLREFAAEGILPWLPGQDHTGAKGAALPSAAVRLKPFFIKAAMVLLLFFVMVAVIGQGISSAGKQLEKEFGSVASWSPEKVARERDRAHVFAEKFGPVLGEILSMFREGPKGAANGTADSLESTQPGKSAE